jgi:hypothetical protein
MVGILYARAVIVPVALSLLGAVGMGIAIRLMLAKDTGGAKCGLCGRPL